MAANSLFMKKTPAIKMVAGVFYLLPFLGRYCQQHTECYTEQCREQHPLFGREQEGNGVSRIPEQRDGLLEYEAPLAIPIEAHHVAAHIDRSE